MNPGHPGPCGSSVSHFLSCTVFIRLCLSHSLFFSLFLVLPSSHPPYFDWTFLSCFASWKISLPTWTVCCKAITLFVLGWQWLKIEHRAGISQDLSSLLAPFCLPLHTLNSIVRAIVKIRYWKWKVGRKWVVFLSLVQFRFSLFLFSLWSLQTLQVLWYIYKQ